MGFRSIQSGGTGGVAGISATRDQAADANAWRQNPDGTYTNGAGVTISAEEKAQRDQVAQAAKDQQAQTIADNAKGPGGVSGVLSAIGNYPGDIQTGLVSGIDAGQKAGILPSTAGFSYDPKALAGDLKQLNNGGGLVTNADGTTTDTSGSSGGTTGNLADSEAGKRASAQAQLLADKFNSMPAPTYVSPTKVTPQASDATVTAAPVTSRDVNYQPGFQAPQIANTPEVDKAPMIGGLPLTSAQQVQAPGDIRAGTVAAQQLGPQSMAKVGDIAQGGQARDAQMEALDRYRAVAEGTAPSAAQALLRQSTDESIGAQLGLAATLQGNTPGLALRSGLSGAANALAKSGSAMAALRAQEQETGRAGFLTAATGIRTGDIQIAQSNQTKDLTTAANNLTAQIDVLKANQQAALDAGKVNVANDLQAQIATATNKLDAAKANAVNSLNSDIANLTATLDASKANQATAVSQNIANLNAKMQTLTADLQAAVSVGNANEANRVQSLIADANRDLEAQKATQQALLDAAKANMQNTQFNSTQRYLADSGNSDREIQAAQTNNAMYTNMGQLTNNALGLPLGATQHDIDVAAAKANAATAGKYALGGTALSALGKYLAA